MKSNLITIVLGSTIFATTLWRLPTWLDGSSAHGRYYATVLLTTSGLVALIALVRLIRGKVVHHRAADRPAVDAATQPRRHYRLQFEASPTPRFLQKADQRQPAATFSCAVRDVSETGLSLDCSGVYAKGQTVCGEIMFPSGRTAAVNGVVIRETDRRTCLDLHCTIDPALLMAEQRERIVADKSDGPRPAVARTLMDTTVGGLPSHSPKGICRLKHP